MYLVIPSFNEVKSCPRDAFLSSVHSPLFFHTDKNSEWGKDTEASASSPSLLSYGTSPEFSFKLENFRGEVARVVPGLSHIHVAFLSSEKLPKRTVSQA